MTLKKFYSILILCLTTLSVDSQSSLSLDDKLSKAAHSKTFESASISISVYDIDSNKEIGGFRSKKVMTPASSFKLLTTFTALKHLGPDYQFETILGYTGTVQKDGTLNGNLIVKGGGDPTLGSDKVTGALGLDDLLEDMTKTIISAGITCVDGKVIVDESIFDSYPVAPSWQWNDLGNYYASGAWGLNIHENLYSVYFKDRGIVGKRPIIHYVSPKVPKLNLSNEIVIDSSHTGDQAYIFGGPYNYDKRIVGTIPQGKGLFSIKGSLPDPPHFFAFHLQKKLQAHNVQSQGIETIFRSSKRRLISIDTIFSPPLSDIVRKANTESNNLYTESMLKLLGLKKIGLGSGQNGLATIIRLMRKYGVDTKKLLLHDGSGLSARTQVSTQAIALFLCGISKELGIEYCTSFIPKGGFSGTVRGMFSKSAARGKVWLKSGSMSAVQSYSGYIHAKNGQWRSFSIVVNGFSQKHSVIRSRLESIINTIYLHSE